MDNPELSIILPLYNRERLITETLDSLLAQSCPNFECIVIDDHSTDSSYKIAQKYQEQDQRFTVKKRLSPKKGAPVCRNEGIDIATGKHLMFLDSDDLMDPLCIEQRLKLIKNAVEKDFYVFPVALFDHQTYIAKYLCADITASNDLRAFITYKGGWNISSTVFKSNFLKGNLYFDEEALSWQDIEFHIRALLITSNYMKFSYSFPDVFVRISNLPRISNTKWTPLKIFSRIKVYLKIEQLLNNDEYNHMFLFFYFRYLENAARTLTKAEFEQIKLYWLSNYSKKSSFSSWIPRYLNFQYFLREKNVPYLGLVLSKLTRTFILKSLTLPQKKKPLRESIDVKKRFYNTRLKFLKN